MPIIHNVYAVAGFSGASHPTSHIPHLNFESHQLRSSMLSHRYSTLYKLWMLCPISVSIITLNQASSSHPRNQNPLLPLLSPRIPGATQRRAKGSDMRALAHEEDCCAEGEGEEGGAEGDSMTLHAHKGSPSPPQREKLQGCAVCGGVNCEYGEMQARREERERAG